MACLGCHTNLFYPLYTSFIFATRCRIRKFYTHAYRREARYSTPRRPQRLDKKKLVPANTHTHFHGFEHIIIQTPTTKDSPKKTPCFGVFLLFGNVAIGSQNFLLDRRQLLIRNCGTFTSNSCAESNLFSSGA